MDEYIEELLDRRADWREPLEDETEAGDDGVEL